MNEILSSIIAYEEGLLEEEEVVELFTNLLRTGLVWQLQGHYQRTVAALVQAGLISIETVAASHSGYAKMIEEYLDED